MMQIINSSIDFPFTYHRDQFTDNFLWLWLSPSLVHVNWSHWLLNILNFYAIVLLFGEAWSLKRFISLFCLFSLFIMISLHLFSKDVENYVGMSGVLYGLGFYGALKTIKQHTLVSVLVLSYLVIKLIWGEGVNHLLGVDVMLKNVTVVTDVHLYGMIIGVVFVGLQSTSLRFTSFVN